MRDGGYENIDNTSGVDINPNIWEIKSSFYDLSLINHNSYYAKECRILQAEKFRPHLPGSSPVKQVLPPGGAPNSRRRHSYPATSHRETCRKEQTHRNMIQLQEWYCPVEIWQITIVSRYRGLKTHVRQIHCITTDTCAISQLKNLLIRSLSMHIHTMEPRYYGHPHDWVKVTLMPRWPYYHD